MKALLKPFVVMLGIIIGTAAADAVYAADTVATGSFSNVAMKTKGTWTLETRDDGVYAVLSEDFKARKASTSNFTGIVVIIYIPHDRFRWFLR